MRTFTRKPLRLIHCIQQQRQKPIFLGSPQKNATERFQETIFKWVRFEERHETDKTCYLYLRRSGPNVKSSRDFTDFMK